MTKLKIFGYLIPALLLSLTACADREEEVKPLVTKGYSFPAEITGFFEAYQDISNVSEEEFVPDSRAILSSEDNWSVRNFENGDRVGFYSANGNMDTPDGNGTFDNVPMYFQKRSGNNGLFINDEIRFNTDYFVPRYSTFYYYPYHEKIEYQPSHDKWEDDDYGIELRQKDGDIEKCVDFMWVIAPSSPTDRQSFAHAFSSIIFLRGKGFENAEDKSVKVYLNKGVSHITLSKTDDYMRNAKLVYLKGYKTELECMEWEAWEGEPYRVTDTTSPYFGTTFEDAYYVILPTTRGSERLSVDHIELKDNDGNIKVVSDFNLYTSHSDITNSKLLFYGNRYPLVIKMKGLETIVTPLSIESWKEDVVIEEVREAGIKDEINFIEWSKTYSQYLSSNRSDTYDDLLKEYGDKTESADGSTAKWTFYINNDLDLLNYMTNPEGGSLQYILGTLDDTLDGLNHTISGVKLESSNPPSFIGELGANGLIKDLNFEGLNIRCIDASSDKPTGGLIGTCRGTISNCDVSGVVTGYGPVGIFAGTADNAVLENCSASGLVVGASSENGGLFGTASNISLQRVTSTGLIFTTN